MLHGWGLHGLYAYGEVVTIANQAIRESAMVRRDVIKPLYYNWAIGVSLRYISLIGVARYEASKKGVRKELCFS